MKAAPETRPDDMLTAALGEVIVRLLADARVTEVMVNPDGRIWAERLADGRFDTGATLSAAATESVIRLLASRAGVAVGRDAPLLAAEMPGGQRFQGLLPPVVARASFVIRQHGALDLSLDDYLEAGVLTGGQARALWRAVRGRKNVLISGGTGSGKTTLANALLGVAGAQEDRLVILEDTRELNCAAADRVELRTSDGQDMNALLRAALRLRPERIIVGEVRGAEALTLLKAWNTGHPGGIATLHANSACLALARLEQLILEGAASVSRALIGDAVDVIVQIARCRGVAAGRRVTELVSVEGYDSATSEYIIKEMS